MTTYDLDVEAVAAKAGHNTDPVTLDMLTASCEKAESKGIPRRLAL
jgi:hypothetical protein